MRIDKDDLARAIERTRRATILHLAERIGCRHMDTTVIARLAEMSDAQALAALRRSTVTSRVTSFVWRVWTRLPG
jgi:hypothetical protein